MTTTSTYLLDTSKKCTISGQKGAFTTKIGGKSVYWSWFGDVDVKCLQSLGASFTENFKSGTKYAEETIEKTLKPVGMAMNAVVKQIPMMKNVNFEKEDSLRNTAIFLYALWNAFTGKSDTETTNKINDFTFGYKYNIPYRADMPILEPLGGSKITINFAYGKCNLFSAKKEVWEPLNALKTALFPTVKDAEGYEGLVNNLKTNTAPAPYPQQIAVQAINKILTDTVKSVTGNGEWKAFDAIEELQNTATNLQDMGSGDIKLKEIGEFNAGMPLTGWGNNEKYFKYSNSFVSNIKAAAKEIYNGSATEINKSTIDKPADDESAMDYDGIMREYASIIKEQALKDANENTEEPQKITWPKSEISVKKVLDKGAAAIKASNKVTVSKAQKDGKIKESMPNVLKALINFVPEKVGSLTSDFYNTLEGYAYTIRMGYPSVFKTNLEDLADVLDVVTPMVTIQQILFTKVNIDFDFDHTDEYGYPMSGKLVIEKVWNLTYPSQTFTLSATGTEKLNTSPLKY